MKSLRTASHICIIRVVLGFPAIATALWPATAAAVTPAILVGPDLRSRQITVNGVRDGELTYFNEQRTLQTEPINRVVQLRFMQPSAPEGETGGGAATGGGAGGATDGETQVAPVPPQSADAAMHDSALELVDGRRLVGKWSGSADDGQTITWTIALLNGEARVSLDQVAAITFAGSALPAAPGQQDMIELTNGDRLEGFVVALKADAIEFQTGDNATEPSVDMPLDRIRAVRLANAPALPAAAAGNADAHRVWLANGSRLLVADLSIGGDTLATRGAVPSRPDLVHNLPLTQVRRIDFALAGARLIDLAGEPYRLTAGGEVFGRTVPPQIEGDTLLLHAPVTVAFDLPAGASRFAAVAELVGEPPAPAPLMSTRTGRVDAPEVLPRPPGAMGRVAVQMARMQQLGRLEEVKEAQAQAAAELAKLAALQGLAPPDAADQDAAAPADPSPSQPPPAPSEPQPISPWADLDLIVRVAGREVGRWHLDSRTPQAQVNLPLDSAELTIELDAGANGPIMDRLRLRDAMVLVGRP